MSEPARSAGAVLRTPRLSLRPASLGDLEALHALFVDPAVRRYLWDDRVIARDETREAIAASEACFPAHGFGQWLLALAGDATIAGFCGLRPIEGEADPELLYALAPGQRGAGLATEACRAVLAHGLGTLALRRIVARVDVPNLASRRVLERLGMGLAAETRIAGRPTLVFAATRATLHAQAVGPP